MDLIINVHGTNHAGDRLGEDRNIEGRGIGSVIHHVFLSIRMAFRIYCQKRISSSKRKVVQYIN